MTVKQEKQNSASNKVFKSTSNGGKIQVSGTRTPGPGRKRGVPEEIKKKINGQWDKGYQDALEFLMNVLSGLTDAPVQTRVSVAMYVIDHRIGKATQKIVTEDEKGNTRPIVMMLPPQDGGQAGSIMDVEAEKPVEIEAKETKDKKPVGGGVLGLPEMADGLAKDESGPKD